MITDIKEIHELFHPDKLKELKDVCKKLNRLNESECADIVFQLYFFIEKTLSVAANLFLNSKSVIQMLENIDKEKLLDLKPNPKAEMRFNKSFPKKI